MSSIPQRRGRLKRLLPTLSIERWDRSKNLRQGVAFAFLLCSLGAAGNWYNWVHGTGTLSFPLGLTAAAAVALMLSPRKWGLLVMSAGGLLGLEILAVVLRKGPVRPVLEMMVVTIAVAAFCQYVRVKIEGSPREGGMRRSNEKQR